MNRDMIINKPTKLEIAKRLGVSRSMMYYKHKRPIVDEEIKRQIESVWVNNPAYGHRRLSITLKMNKKRIIRVMKKFKMKPYRRRSKIPRKKKDEGREEVGGINVTKVLCPLAPNIVWVSDFTYIKYQGKFIYMATIMDMYTREIIGISLSRYHDTNLILEAFIDAVIRRGATPLYLHSDQGSEYTSEEYRECVEEKTVQLSYSDKGSPWQNGYQESFYDKFKVDLGEVDRYEGFGELCEAIYNTIYYYNNNRIHTSLKMSPVAFKKSFLSSRDILSNKLGT